MQLLSLFCQLGFYFLLFFNTPLKAQTTWFVDQQNGNDNNNGLTENTAFASTDKVFRGQNAVISPGDTVVISGEYTNPSYNPAYSYDYGHSACDPDDGDDILNPNLWHAENTINIRNVNGAPGQYITIRAKDASTILKGDGANIFRMVNCSYFRIEGFTIRGETPNISLREALSIQFLYINNDLTPDTRRTNPQAGDVLRYIELCAEVEEVEQLVFNDGTPPPDVTRPSRTDTRGMFLTRVNHVDIISNDIQDMPGGGLRVSESEYVNMIGNEIAYNSGRSFSGTHGLVVTKALSTISANADPNDDDIYRIKIINNLIHHNFNMVYSYDVNKDAVEPRLDEGKGISLQRNQEPSWSNGTSRFLVANNICYWNGFSGVHTNDGDNMTFVNNTCYNNSYTNSITYAQTYQQMFGELFDPAFPSYDPYAHYDPSGGNIGISISDGQSHIVKNNISVIDADLGRFPMSTNQSNGIDDGGQPMVYENNIIYVDDPSRIADLIQDPDVVAVDLNTQVADPLFNDPDGGDFTLQDNSPAIGFADPACVLVPTDYFGLPRDANPDAGAVEFEAVLPIVLATFTATIEGKTGRLSWTTLSESNNDYFSVERLALSGIWVAIGRVSGNGQSSAINSYHFIDTAPLTGINFYRLRQYDFNGQNSVTDIRSLRFRADPSKPYLFPNPVNKVASLTNISQVKTITVYNALGQRIFLRDNQSGQEQLQLPTENWSAGTYYVVANEEVLTLIRN